MDTSNFKLYLFDFDNNVGQNECSEQTWKTVCAIKGLCTINAYWKILTRLKFDEKALAHHLEVKSASDNAKLFQFGISCLANFVQSNFTGPDLDDNAVAFLQFEKYPPMDYNKKLAINNDEVNVNTKFACLLVAAKLIFKVYQDKQEYRLLSRWWRWRSIIIHQQVLDEMSPTLLTTAEALGKDLDAIAAVTADDEKTEDKTNEVKKVNGTTSSDKPALETINENDTEVNELTKPVQLSVYLRAKLHLERAQLFILYRRSGRAAEHLARAQSLLGVHCELVGALGRRTRHQEHAIAQLACEIRSVERPDLQRPPVHTTTDTPKNVSIKDDVRLERVKYELGAVGGSRVRLPNLEQQLLLIQAQQNAVSKPQDGLDYEEVQPLFEEILSQDNTWLVRFATLLLRCHYEHSHKRTVERSLLQSEELLNCIQRSKPSALHRLGAIYALGLPPKWSTSAQYGRIMLSLGLVKSALEVFVPIKLWEEVIVCWTLLEEREKAAKVIREQLEHDPDSIRLHCWLGDCLKDESCYETAWELSKKRSHRVQRHWGLHHFNEKAYDKCIPHLEKSVSINPLQATVWSRLGFAALETKNWQVAATAYRRYTTLEPDSYESWNNLAQAYIKLGNKRSAHQALTEALRCNYDNWRIWENFLVVSADIGQYADIIRAYQRLLDLKEKYLNTDVLGVLVRGIFENADDAGGTTSGGAETGGGGGKQQPLLLKRTRELLGRITGIFPGEGLIWEGYALLSPNASLRLLRLQRAFRAYTQSPNWTASAKHCAMVLNVCQGLAEVALDEGALRPDDTSLHSVRLALGSAVAALQRRDHAETRELLAHVAQLQEQLVQRVGGTGGATAKVLTGTVGGQQGEQQGGAGGASA